MPQCSPPLRTKVPQCSPHLHTYRIVQQNSKFVNTNSHLSGWPVPIRIASSLNSEVQYSTYSKRFTNSPPKRLQVNEPTSSRNWFMTGHSTPQTPWRCSHMASTSPLVYVQQKLSGSDFPGLSIITANGWTLSLGKPKRVHNLQVFTASPGSKCYQITYAVCMSMWRVSPLRSNAVTVVNCRLFCKKRYIRGKSTVGECRRNPMWPEIRYMRGRCNRGSYNDKA
jgi:hypothetical protein